MGDSKQPSTTGELLAGRRYEDLSATEKKLLGERLRKSAEESAQRIVDNLNSKPMRD